MTKLSNNFKLWPLTALFCLTLSSCGTPHTASSVTQLGGTVCDSQASLVNPNAKNFAPDGIGGTGIRLTKNESNGGAGGGEGGIGGTGIIAGSDKPVFGTGGVGGTGIVGVITGFASICVNGVEVNYDTTTPVWQNGKPSTISQLAVGQVVAVTAIENGQQTIARGIGVIQAVVGPISAINAATGELRVMGQKIEASRMHLVPLKVGDWLRVSGHRLASGEVLPSHAQPMPSQANMQAQVRGNAQNISGKTLLLGETRVDMSTLAATTATADFVSGDELLVSGTWNGQLLQAKEVIVNPTLLGLGRVDKIVLEGYIHSSSGRNLSLGSQTLVLSGRTQIVGGSSRDLVLNRRVQVTGHIGADQRIAVDRVEFSRQSRSGSNSKSSSSQDDSSGKTDTSNLVKTSSDDSGSSNSGSGSSGSSGSGSSNSGKASSNSGSGSSGSSGSGSSGSGSSGSNSGSSGSTNSGSSNSGSSGSSGSSSSGKGSSGSSKSSSK